LRGAELVVEQVGEGLVGLLRGKDGFGFGRGRGCGAFGGGARVGEVDGVVVLAGGQYGEQNGLVGEHVRCVAA
jgi:hypothetical protein